MHQVELSHNYLKKALPNVHLARLNRTMLCSSSLLQSGNLTLSSLGRHIKGEAKVKNKIKAVDRLLGNSNLQGERKDFYKAIARKAIGSLTEIDVLVDWSPAGKYKKGLHVLKASLAYEGRSVTLYEEVHPAKVLGNFKVHQQFLLKLKEILPSHCHPLIITDAGFNTDWFELVLSHNWDFEGRVRGKKMFKFERAYNWKSISFLHKKANSTPKYMGCIQLTKSRKFECELYLYQDKKREPLTKKRTLNKNKRYSKRKREPWVLVTSVKHKNTNAKKVVKRYSRRMKIEHEFRVTKNVRLGLGLSGHGTKECKRLEILLLIAHIALFTLWLI